MNKKPLKLFAGLLLLILHLHAAYAASNFSITPVAGSIFPSFVPPGATVSAYYTVANLTNSSRSGYRIQGLPSSVTQNTSETNCQTVINLASGASCMLQLDITAATHSNFVICNATNCTAAATPLNVQVGYNHTYAYVADRENVIWQCPLNSTGGFQNSTCTGLTNTTAPGFDQGLYTAFHTFSGITYAYVSNYNSQLWKCRVNASGSFSSCVALTNTPAFGHTSFTSFHKFSGTTYAYVADLSNTLWKCPLDANGNFSSSCTALTNSSPLPLYYSTAVTFKDFSGLTYAYIGDVTNALWKCTMAPNGNFSGNCTTLTNSPGFSQTAMAAFNQFSGNTYSYVTDLNTKLWQCPMSSAGNFSGACVAFTNSPPFYRTHGATFSNYMGNAYLYVGDHSSAIWQCPIDKETGVFTGTCTALNGFYQTIGVTFDTI